LKVWPILGIVFIQAFLLFAHWFLFFTLIAFFPMGQDAMRGLGLILLLLSISFVVAALLGFHHSNLLVRLVYRSAAVWLGAFNFAFWAACLCWVVDAVYRFVLRGQNAGVRPGIAAALFTIAIAAAIYGLANARRIRVERLEIALPNLPPSWRGRTALLVSDLHLGNVNGAGFARRVAAIAQQLNPAILFVAGDLFDGVKAHPADLAGPIFALDPPLGTYFCGGNHEDFGDAAEYEAALRNAGISALQNQSVDVDGILVIGVSYADSVYPLRLRAFLDGLELGNGRASILLNHVPKGLPIVEQAGVSLQLSGHTHGGQLFPFTWFTRHAFGKFTYGLQRFGRLQVLTSSGVGTWGPPMRVGTAPEVVLITFA
jgi:predicted MPP superfamily phosphohydrolase